MLAPKVTLSGGRLVNTSAVQCLAGILLSDTEAAARAGNREGVRQTTGVL